METITFEKDNWVAQLEEGHIVWLCKEQIFAMILKPFFAEDEDAEFGTIGLRKEGSNQIEIWGISRTGTGFDGYQLITVSPEVLINLEKRVEDMMLTEVELRGWEQAWRDGRMAIEVEEKERININHYPSAFKIVNLTDGIRIMENEKFTN